MVKDMTTGEVWTPDTDFVRDMYNLGRYVDDTKAEHFPDTTGGQGARESEFDRWLNRRLSEAWKQGKYGGHLPENPYEPKS